MPPTRTNWSLSSTKSGSTKRFADPTPVVINVSYDLLQTLAHLVQDFIRMQILDDVLPRLNEFMIANITSDFTAHQTKL